MGSSQLTEQGWKDAWEREWERMGPLYQYGLNDNDQHSVKDLARCFFLTGYVIAMRHETSRMLAYFDKVTGFKP